MKDLTQEKLKTVLHYNADTGEFTWLQRSKGRRKNGVAGWQSGKGYIAITLDYKKYRAHRLAWFWVHGEWPADEIDHINGIRDDNRLANLRSVTKSENARNKRRYKKNKSGANGVSWYKPTGKWVAYLGLGGKRIHLGHFECKATAGYVAKHFRAKLGAYGPNHGKQKNFQKPFQ